MEKTKKFDESVINLAKKMAEDKEFQDSLTKAETVKQMYDIYVKYGYTDQTFENFELFLNTFAMNQMQIHKSQELSDEELEMVAGGGFLGTLFKYVRKAVSYIPVVGPCVNTVIDAADAVKDVIKDPKNALNTLKKFGKNTGENLIGAIPGAGTGYSIAQDLCDALRDSGIPLPGTRVTDTFK